MEEGILRTEILDFKVTVITARFKDQEEFARNLNPASRWQIMAFLSSLFVLSLVPSATPELMTQPQAPGLMTKWTPRAARIQNTPGVEGGRLSRRHPGTSAGLEVTCPQGAVARGGSSPLLPLGATDTAGCATEAYSGFPSQPNPDLFHDLDQFPTGTMTGRGLFCLESLKFDEAGD